MGGIFGAKLRKVKINWNFQRSGGRKCSNQQNTLWGGGGGGGGYEYFLEEHSVFHFTSDFDRL